jgi:MATE family multidrug resistance protein
VNFSKYLREFPANFRLAYPVILGMLGHTLIGIVDKLMVGQLGPAALAAVSLGNSFFFVAMSLGVGFSTAITPLVGEADAANDKSRVRQIFRHGLLLCTILGSLLFLIVFLCKPLLSTMGQPDDVIVLARPYLDWIALSLIPVVMYQGYKQFADGMSMTKYSMFAIILGNIIHVPINYALIHGLWIIPGYGVEGAALGSLISRILMVIFLHLILSNNQKLEAYFKDFFKITIHRKLVSKIIGLGLPSAMQMMFEVVLFTASVWLCGTIGKTSQAANEIALSLATLTFMFASGLSVTGMIRVSNQRGLNDYRHLVVVARSIFLMVVLIEIVFALLFIAFHQILPQFFLNLDNAEQVLENREVITIAAKLLVVAAIFQISDGVQVVVLGALRGLQDVKIPMYITFVAYWIIGFPISYYLGKFTQLKAVGVWIGLLAGLTAAAVFLYIRFEKLTRRSILKSDR